MRKFADRKSLEYTKFACLRDLVDEVVQQTVASLEDGDLSHTKVVGTINRIVEAFCEKQDTRMRDERLRERNEEARKRLGPVPRKLWYSNSDYDLVPAEEYTKLEEQD